MKLSFLVDCQWASWDAWSGCGSSCSARDGTGNQTRTRDPRTPPTNSGAACNGDDGTGDQSCSVECPGEEIKFIYIIPFSNND